MFRNSKIIADQGLVSVIYLKGDNFLTNGEKKGSLTFCWEKNNYGFTQICLYDICILIVQFSES